MKDLIKRLFISLLSGGYLGYVLFLFLEKKIIVQGAYLADNMIAYFVLIAIAAFILILFGVYPVKMKFTKSTIFVIGIAMLIGGEYVMINNISEYVYIADITKILGAILMVLSPTKLLITQKVQKSKKNDKMEIIEV